MIAIKDRRVWNKYCLAVELLSVLDQSLVSTHRSVSAYAYPHKHDSMRQYYEEMTEAINLHTAATSAMTAAATHRLESEFVDTFFLLAEHSCLRALSALDFAIHTQGDINFSGRSRDRFKSAFEKSQESLAAVPQ